MDSMHRSVTKVSSGIPVQSPRACITQADREQWAAVVGEQQLSDLPTLTPCFGPGFQLSALRLQSPSPLSQPSLKNPDLTQSGPCLKPFSRFPWPKGQVTRP